MQHIEEAKVALAVLAVPFLVAVAGCTGIIWLGQSQPQAASHPTPPAQEKVP